ARAQQLAGPQTGGRRYRSRFEFRRPAGPVYGFTGDAYGRRHSRRGWRDGARHGGWHRDLRRMERWLWEGGRYRLLQRPVDPLMPSVLDRGASGVNGEDWPNHREGRLDRAFDRPAPSL